MFNNLIESSSHGRELRQRGSFLLLTTASYALLFSIVGVVSIHAYDAHMEDQNLEIVTLLPPVLAAPVEEPQVTPDNPGNNNNRRQAFDERQLAIAPIDRVTKPPDKIETRPNPDLPVRPEIPTIIGNRTSNAELGGGVGSAPPGSGSNIHTSRIITEVEPPPLPTPPPVPKVIRKKIINSEAISLPKPAYPPLAQQNGTQGSVSVQVLIDEMGKVISAKAMSGHPFLAPAAVRAAYQARFSPTTLGDQPVKVSGVITYNFILQR